MQPTLPTPRGELIMAGASSVRLDMDLRAGRTVAAYRGVYVAAGRANGLLQRATAALRTHRPPAVMQE